MEGTFAKLKRRGTDLMHSIPQNVPSMPQVQLPSMPAMPSMASWTSRRAAHHGLKGTWQPLDIPLLPRSSHSLDIVAGNAYLFGGEAGDGDNIEPTRNDMHVITLPWSIGSSADYYPVPPKPSPKTASSAPSEPVLVSAAAESGPSDTDKGKAVDHTDEDVPAARSGHATAVIGSRIFLFGGRSGSKTLEEKGRVWIFETKTQTWTYLDPHPSSPIPAGRSDHAAVASEQPRDFATAFKMPRRASTWKEWAEGDSSTVGIPQRPIAGAVAETATDDETAGYGTLFIHGGNVVAGGGGTTKRSSDVWAFDVHARTWAPLPDAPGPGRSGAHLALAQSRLYRFGGWDGDRVLGGQLDVLGLLLDSQSGEIGVSARGAWESIMAPSGPPSTPSPETAGLTSAGTKDDYPAPRSAASMSVIKAGGGWEYLLLQHGQAASPADSPAACHGDVWAFQVPPLGGTAASVSDAFVTTIKNARGEPGNVSFQHTWTRVTTGPSDPDDENEELRSGGKRGSPAPRASLAAASLGELEENAILVLGGIDETGRRLGDAWIFRLGGK